MKLKKLAVLAIAASCLSVALPSYANDVGSFESSNVSTQITNTVEELNSISDQLKNLADELAFRYQGKDVNIQSSPSVSHATLRDKISKQRNKKIKECEEAGGQWGLFGCGPKHRFR